MPAGQSCGRFSWFEMRTDDKATVSPPLRADAYQTLLVP
jgi:hypothetical protein